MKRKFTLLILLLLFATTAAGCSLVQKPSESTTTEVTTAPTEASTVDEVTTSEKTSSATTAVTTALPTETATPIQVIPVVKPEPTEKPTETKPETKPAKPAKLATADETEESPPNGDYKYIAFTFDDGPHYELTYMFADKLAQYGGKGTFFVVGNRLDSAGAAAVKYAYDLGNEIAVHGYTHTKYYDSCSDKEFKSELSKTAKAIKKATGFTPTLMRPIGGAITNDRVKSCGYDVILWNVDTEDWRYAYGDTKQNVKTIYNNIIRATDENDIILLHEIYYNSYEAFSKAVDKLYKDGYRFVTVSELLGRSEDSKNHLYYSAD